MATSRPKSNAQPEKTFARKIIDLARRVRALELRPDPSSGGGGGGGTVVYGAKLNGVGVSVGPGAEVTVPCAGPIEDPQGLSDGVGFTVTEDGIYIFVGSFTASGVTDPHGVVTAIVRNGTSGDIYGMADHYNESVSTSRLACNVVAGAFLTAGTDVLLRVYSDAAISVFAAGGPAQNQNDHPQFTVAKVG